MQRTVGPGSRGGKEWGTGVISNSSPDSICILCSINSCFDQGNGRVGENPWNEDTWLLAEECLIKFQGGLGVIGAQLISTRSALSPSLPRRCFPRFTPLAPARKRLPPAWFGANPQRVLFRSRSPALHAVGPKAIARQRAPDVHFALLGRWWG